MTPPGPAGDDPADEVQAGEGRGADRSVGVSPEIRTLLDGIGRLTVLARRVSLRETLLARAQKLPPVEKRPAAPSSEKAVEADGAGWWVLAQGETLDPDDFAAREAAREALLARVRASGVFAGENVWVWDEAERAQLVLATLPTLERARRVADRLRQKGLRIVVRREIV